MKNKIKKIKSYHIHIKDRQQTKQNKPTSTNKAKPPLPPSGRKAGKRLLYNFIGYTTRMHLRAVLGLPIPEITQERIGASAVILSPIASKEAPRYRGEEEVCKETNTYLRIFGKPYTKLNRRMGVVVCYAPNGSDLDALRDKCKAVAAKVEVY